MAIVEPISTANAIDEIAFVVLFKENFDRSTIEKIKELHSSLSAELTHIEPIKVMQVKVDSAAGESSTAFSQLSGYKLFKPSITKQGRFDWSLIVEGNNIVVGCSAYSRWNEVWPKARGFLEQAVTRIHGSGNAVVEIGFQCVDRFKTDIRSEADYHVDQIFNSDSSFLTRAVFEKNQVAWHVHQGWFVESADSLRTGLVNLNISTNLADMHITTINHVVKTKRTDGALVDTGELFNSDLSNSYIDLVINRAHSLNKEILLNLLNEDMLQKIGLR